MLTTLAVSGQPAPCQGCTPSVLLNCNSRPVASPAPACGPAVPELAPQCSNRAPPIRSWPPRITASSCGAGRQCLGRSRTWSWKMSFPSVAVPRERLPTVRGCPARLSASCESEHAGAVCRPGGGVRCPPVSRGAGGRCRVSR